MLIFVNDLPVRTMVGVRMLSFFMHHLRLRFNSHSIIWIQFHRVAKSAEFKFKSRTALLNSKISTYFRAN